jgi:hypothetical protein
MLYTNPALLGSDFSIESLMALSGITNIRYSEDTTSDTGRVLSLTNCLGGKLEGCSAPRRTSQSARTAASAVGGQRVLPLLPACGVHQDGPAITGYNVGDPIPPWRPLDGNAREEMAAAPTAADRPMKREPEK